MTATIPPSGPGLVFERVSKWYGVIAALTDVSFSVGCEVVGLVGKNGVGKSTLLRLAAGLARPSEGSVRVGGHRTTSLAGHAQLGFCPDTERLFEAFDAVTFVAWMLRYHGLDRRSALARSEEVLTELGLGAAMRRPVREYSKGMRQRVRLAQALAHRPKFLLLDEPMNGLDPVARRDLSEHIRSLPARGVGVLLSSHVLHELEAVTDRVVLVHQGRLVAEGTVGDLRAKMPTRPHRLRIVVPNPRDLATRLVQWDGVVSVQLMANSVELAVVGEAFYARLTELGATWPQGFCAVEPLDDDLASVFGYLVR